MTTNAGETLDLELSQEPEGAAADENAGSGATDEQATDEDEVVVSIGDTAPPPPEEEAKAPEWVRELRRKHREEVKRNKDLEARLHALTAEAKPAEIGKEPELEDFDFDTSRFKTALLEWQERKNQVENEKKKAKEAEDKATAEWQAKLDGYAKAKTALKVKDMAEAEADVLESFNGTQQGIVIQGSENPALVVYALGKNPEKRQELAAISDPVKFAFAIAKLEVQLKVTKKNAPPPPETRVSGTGRNAGTVDSTLERLRAEAEKTGDYTKVAQYKKQQRAKTT